MSIPRRHHLVPEHHLRRFANEKDQVRAVSREDLSRSFVTSVKKVPVEVDFYAVDTEDGQSQAVELLLSNVEAVAAPSVNRMIGGSFPPSPEDRWSISAFVAAQWLRGWDQREAMNVLVAHMIQMHMVNLTRDRVRQFFRESENREAGDDEVEGLVAFARDPSKYRISVPPDQHLRSMLEMLPGLTNLAFARTWQLLRIHDGSLVTSDAPVTTWTSPGRSNVYSGGFGASEELALSLARHHALVLAHEAPSGEIVRDVGAAHARELNIRTATSGRRYVIHHPDDQPLTGLQIPPPRPKLSMSQPPRRIVPEDA